MKKIIPISVILMLVTSFMVVFPIYEVEAVNVRAEFYPMDDAMVSEGNPDYNHGHGAVLRFRTKSGIQRLNFIKFDISAIPSGTTIKSATLKFYWYSQHDGSAFGYTASAYRVTSDWDEHNVTWNNQPSCNSIATNTTTMPSSLGTWVSWDVTSDVQDFIDAAEDNQGWKTEGNNFSGNTLTDFWSKEYRDYYPEEPIGLQPCLEIKIDEVYVDDDYTESTLGWGFNHFDKIQDGIDAVDIGGTVYVYNGTYYENVVVDKSINLIGEDKNTTIIDGGDSGDVVLIIVNHVNISSFKIQNSGSYHNGGIHIEEAEYNNVYDNIITSSCTDCIWLKYSSNNTISNNIIFGSWRGMLLQYSTNNTIVDNSISSMDDEGILIEYNPSHSYGNIFYHNNFISNSINAWDYGNNTWDSGTEGNYWDDYIGEDNNGDGIGDTPYNISGGSNQDLYPLMYPIWDNPPDAPTIDGPTNGNVGVEYFYKFVTNDPDLDNICLWVEWGDGDNTGWIGLYQSGEEEILSHTWTSQGTYNIKAKAKDIWGAESDWFEFTVTIPRNKALINPFILQLLERFPFLQRLFNMLEVLTV